MFRARPIAETETTVWEAWPIGSNTAPSGELHDMAALSQELVDGWVTSDWWVTNSWASFSSFFQCFDCGSMAATFETCLFILWSHQVWCEWLITSYHNEFRMDGFQLREYVPRVECTQETTPKVWDILQLTLLMVSDAHWSCFHNNPTDVPGCSYSTVQPVRCIFGTILMYFWSNMYCNLFQSQVNPTCHADDRSWQSLHLSMFKS